MKIERTASINNVTYEKKEKLLEFFENESLIEKRNASQSSSPASSCSHESTSSRSSYELPNYNPQCSFISYEHLNATQPFLNSHLAQYLTTNTNVLPINSSFLSYYNILNELFYGLFTKQNWTQTNI